MNRHFYAFGVLLGSLATWMAAVGGSPSASAARLAPRQVAALPGDGGCQYCAFHVLDGAYAAGCGLDRNTGTVYDCSATAPAPVKLEVAKAAPADVVKSVYDGHAICDPAYDEAVYGDAEEIAAEASEAPAIQTVEQTVEQATEHAAEQTGAPWMSQEDREWQETLAYFESLVAKAKQPAPKHCFYDELAAADYAAAELAAAKEAEAEADVAVADIGKADVEAKTDVEAEVADADIAVAENDEDLVLPAREVREVERPRFSAVIRVLPDSNLADDLRPVIIGLRVRGQWTLEKLGLEDDLQAAIALFQPETIEENAAELAWNHYNNFAESVVEVAPVAEVAPPVTPEVPKVNHERYISATADFLESFSRMSHEAAQELRRIASTRVAKSNSGELPPATKR